MNYGITAVLSGMDTHPANSIGLMLRSIGYEIYMLNDIALGNLQKRGYTGGVLREMLDEMGYDQPKVKWCDENMLEKANLFVDLKTQDIDSMVAMYPNLKNKSLHFLINGGKDDYENCGFNYPVVTSNMWVQGQAFKCYMPFDNIHNLNPRGMLDRKEMRVPIGLLHNAWNWGFQAIIPGVIKETGLLIYGHYNSPAGMLPSKEVGEKLKTAQCFVHLKANDCPGYALYEALASGVPVVVTELMLDRMKYRELFANDKTCLTWGEGSYEICGENIVEYIEKNIELMVKQIDQCVRKLRNPEDNYRIGMAGYRKWKELTDWTPAKVAALKKFFRNNKMACK